MGGYDDVACVDPSDLSTHAQLSQLSSIPKPSKYTLRKSKGSDSGYGSHSSNTSDSDYITSSRDRQQAPDDIGAMIASAGSSAYDQETLFSLQGLGIDDFDTYLLQ
jgi:hypothetical protein